MRIVRTALITQLLIFFPAQCTGDAGDEDARCNRSCRSTSPLTREPLRSQRRAIHVESTDAFAEIHPDRRAMPTINQRFNRGSVCRRRNFPRCSTKRTRQLGESTRARD